MTASTANAQRFREFKMPDVGEGLTEAEILKWYVQPGDTVTDGQVVCEVETAKAAVELPIPYTGVVHELRFGEGVTVDVGTAIIAVDTDPGAGPAEAPAAAPQEAAADEEAEPQGRQAVLVGYGAAPSSTKRRARKPQPGVPAQPEPAQAALQAELNGRIAPAAPAAPVAPAVQPAPAAPAGSAVPAAGRPLAKPPVRKLAKDLGIDLATILPTRATRWSGSRTTTPAPSRRTEA
ncbi:biotin/lipoyl-containing protein, partial [Streptomyces lydicus]|uniref:biotin/lipoyl-containing protein n=1 Tax=Streptomyces lydicus TaxID=47763 RepID=UPI0033180081